MARKIQITKKKVGRPPRLTKHLVEQVFSDWVEDRIPGFRLPTEEQLIKQYNVNRKTVRAAIACLEAESKLDRKPSGGTFVAAPMERVWRNYWGKSVALLFPDPLWFEQEFTQRVYRGISLGLEQTGLHVSVPTRRWRGNFSPDELMAHFGSSELVGMIFVGSLSSGLVKALIKLPIPKVAADFDISEQGIDSFCFDNLGAGQMLARRLIRLGHKRIAAVFESPAKPTERQDVAWAERRNGFLAELNSGNDIQIFPVHVGQRSLTSPAQQHLRSYLRMPASRRPTALYIPMDLLDQVESLAAEEGLRIPRDLSVVGIDELNHRGSLTAVNFDGQKLGDAAVTHLMRKIRDPKWKSRRAKMVKIKGYYVAMRSHGKAP